MWLPQIFSISVNTSSAAFLVQMCRNGKCPANQYQPEKDVFNAAQSGAVAPNLVSHEFSYLLEQLKTVRPGSVPVSNALYLILFHC